ncbi:hypothetical protein BC938DRAFT_474793 [Jimgerdemannia flammicorona]|uniref:Uncharacterized protein n=1 Tax=Jimgerdemannia flammicorona TaxID=994334 RepID=A0A433QSB7_9FUNG|nr:hypothetical protein BC938DRAFT_474793 [Jimgerdemannia flammicorona]
MQWRVLIVFLVGLSFIYAISLFQDNPYPQPRIACETLESHLLFPRGTQKPNEVFVSVVGEYLYLTATWFEVGGAKHGRTQIKVGAVGLIRQFRRPFTPFVTLDCDAYDNNAWEEQFEHTLDGPISHVTSSPSGEPTDQLSDAYLTLMYHVVYGEEVTHMARVYFVGEEVARGLREDATPLFRYRDFILPGTTWIDSIVWYNGSVIYSRDPDDVRFRALTFNPRLFEPRYEYADAFKMGMGEKGEELQTHHTPRDTHFHQAKFSKLYSSRPNTLRVVSAEIFQTSEKLFFNISIVDNATTPAPADTSGGSTREAEGAGAGKGSWKRRDRITKYYMQDYEPSEYVGFMDYPSPYLRERVRMSVPKLNIASSLSATTVVIPINYIFLTLDYTTDIALIDTAATTRSQLYQDDAGAVLPELYLWSEDEQLPALEGNADVEISGVELNAEGNIVALRTQYNDIVIYKRGAADALVGPRRPPTIWELLDERLNIEESRDAPSENGGWEGEPIDTPARAIEAARALQWKLRMVVKGEWGGGVAGILSMKLWNATQPYDEYPSNYLLVVRSDGRLTSYHLESREPEYAPGLLGFVLRKWEMFIGMITVIAVFVFNEAQHR